MSHELQQQSGGKTISWRLVLYAQLFWDVIYLASNKHGLNNDHIFVKTGDLVPFYCYSVIFQSL